MNLDVIITTFIITSNSNKIIEFIALDGRLRAFALSSGAFTIKANK